MSNFFGYAINGIPYGCVYALVAVGLVLIYKTSGVYNLAFGAQAFVSAAIFYICVAQAHWSKWAAFVLAVVVTGPVFGLALDRGLFRFMRTATPTVKLVSSLGLLVGIPPVVTFLWSGDHFNPPSIAPNPNHLYRFGSHHVDGNQLMVMIITVAVVILLGALFRFTAVGLKMRAVVESPRMVELAGINSERVSMFAWMLSSFLTALAGVLIGPFNPNLNDASSFTALLVAASAAAAFGGMFSLPLTLLGGLLLGMCQQILGGYLPLNSIVAVGLRPAFPFVVLVILLLFWPPLRRGGKPVSDPLASCDPPPPTPLSTRAVGTLSIMNKASYPFLILAFVVVSLFFAPTHQQFLLTQVLVFGVVFVSINMITGLSGQLSLCQFSFGGIGCFIAGECVAHYNMPILVALPIGAVVAAAAGALVAIPALRLEGLYLSLATLSFALLADNVLFPWIGNGATGLSIPRPKIGSIDFTSNRSFYVLSFIVLVICAFVFGLVKRGTTGRYLAAIRGSEVAAATIGINPSRVKIIVFAFSAGIAGVGGTMYGMLNQRVSPTDFNFEFSLVFVVLVLTTGSRTVEGATNASFGFIWIQTIFQSFGTRFGQAPAFLFGFGSLGYAKHPEGVGDFQKERSLMGGARVIDRRILRRAAVETEEEPTAPPSDVLATVAPAAPSADGTSLQRPETRRPITSTRSEPTGEGG